MAKVVSFINLKGGVGKTTLALAIGETLAFSWLDRRVLLIDLDAQTNLSHALVSQDTRSRLTSEKKTVYHMFRAALDGQRWDMKAAITGDCSNIQGNSRLRALVCTEELGQLDEDILNMLEEGKKIGIDFRRILKDHVAVIQDDFDWIIIDCPPSLSTLTSNAIVASDYFVVPVIPEYLSLQGLTMIQQRIAQLKNRLPYGTELKIDFAGSIVNKVDVRRSDAVARAEDIYSQQRGVFAPLETWLGDWKPLYTVSNYNQMISYHDHLSDYRFQSTKFLNVWDKLDSFVKTPRQAGARQG